ncbi:MAG: hypothetical protein WAZ19_14650 [Anaerolineae bacterium]
MILLSLVLSLFGMVPQQASAQVDPTMQVTYGLIQDPNDPLLFTAVMYPTFTGNITISTALFTFTLPAGTVTDPAIRPAPALGDPFIDKTGIWLAQLLSTDVWTAFGLNPADLEGKDVYQVVLQNSPITNVTAGQPLSLYSFRLPNACTGGNVEVLTNDSPLQQAILAGSGANFNNQMSVRNNAVGSNISIDRYVANDPATALTPCSALAAQLAGFEASSQGDGVQVVWETVSEATTASFNLYRSTSIDGEWTLLTNMPATGGGMGAVYTYTDTNVELGSMYFYSLEDVDVNGNTHRYDPVSVVHQAPTAVTLSTLAANAGNLNSMLPILLIVLLSGVLLLWRRQAAR